MSDKDKPLPAIYSAMNAVMSEVGAIGKDSKNQQQGFKFRGIDSIYNSLHSILAKNGIFTTSEILEDKREERKTQRGGVLAFVTIKMRYTFHALDGSSVTTDILGEGMDSGDKASNKAMSIAHKYALLQAFCIPTEEQKDPDAQTYDVADPDDAAAERPPKKTSANNTPTPREKHQPPAKEGDTVSQAQADYLAELIKETGTEVDKLFAFLRVEELEQLTINEYGYVARTLNTKKEAA